MQVDSKLAYTTEYKYTVYQLHLQYRPFYRHTLTTIKWHHKKEKNEELVTLISKKFQSYYAPLRLPWPKTRNIRGNLRWKEFSHFYTSTHDMVHYQVERTLSLSCRDYNYSYIILYPPGMSPLEINSSESCGPVQHMLRYSQELTFRPQSAFKNDIQ